ncbi:hypothetical protein pipiens_018354 [Culex pipiens pipiens]|uniref:Reverse transcriptase n=1 Tax=Culex pipiens pipiens TaxID=38569 RepID=A0ABD1CC51_CULPP
MDAGTKYSEEYRHRKKVGLPERYLHMKDHPSDFLHLKGVITPDLELFSNSDNVRSIPCVLDGLKPGQRKFMFTCFKRNDKQEVKVAQLAGSVAEMFAYHHGEQSLCSTIVNLKQNIVSSNNINLLYPRDQFGALQKPTIQETYHHELKKRLPCTPQPDINLTWEKLAQKTKQAASVSLKKCSVIPHDKGCRQLAAKVAKARFWMSWKPSNRIAERLSAASSELQAALKRQDEQAWTEFFRDVGKLPLGVRIRRTQQCFKKHKRQQGRPVQYSSVPIDAWKCSSDADGLPSLIEEVDGVALPQGPTVEDLCRILAKMGNGKSPGQDRLPAEYFKYADESTLQELLQVIKSVWDTNCMPAAWKHTAVVPIPKVSKPTSAAHYRRISLLSTGYKIYAMWVLEHLQRYVGEIGSHQAAFLPGRSTTDHLFVTQRVLQEKWNEGTVLYIMSLDLEKAFDRVNLKCLPAILKDKGVPHCVINRVVECLRGDIEQTIFQGETSHPEPRLGGVRQGCPISPFAFDLIIEAVMISVEEELGIFVLNQKNRLSLPLVLVYADDVLILTEDVVSLEKIVACMESYLETVGLNLNRDKCQLLVRDPMGPSVKTVTLLGVDYDVQKSMKYLGISLTNRLSPEKPVLVRCGGLVTPNVVQKIIP